MTVIERHSPPHHYLFNTRVIDADPSLFDSNSALFASTTSHNNNGRGTVLFQSLNTASGNVNVVIKKYQRGGLVRHFNKSLYWHNHYSQSRVWLEFKLLTKMISMGLPVPEPIAGRASRKFHQWFESTIVTREIENAATLAERLKHPTPDLPDNTVWQKIGETIRRFHLANIYHADLNASNILLTESGDVYLIDFDKGRSVSRQAGVWQKDNLDRLHRSLQKYRRIDDQFQYTANNWRTLLAGYEQ